MQALGIIRRMNAKGFNAQGVGCLGDPNGDFSAVGNQQPVYLPAENLPFLFTAFMNP